METSSKYSILVQFVSRSRKNAAILPKQGLHAVVLNDTLLAEFIEKAVCMKTGEQLYQRESERPRVALEANSKCESQDLLSQKARSSKGNTKRSAKLPGDWMQHRGLPNPRHISLNGSGAG